MDGPTATLLLEAARLYQPKRPDIALPCAYTIIATLLLTGLRPSEGLGLLIEDIDFESCFLPLSVEPVGVRTPSEAA